MQLNYNLFCMSLLILSIWFSHVCVKKIAYHRKIMIVIMWAGVLLLLENIFGILMEEGIIPQTDTLVYIEKSFFYVITIVIYALYAYFLYCIVDHIHYYSLWKKWLLFSMCVVMDVLIIASYWTHWLYYVEDGVFYKGKLFFLIFVVRDIYGLIATFRAFYRRKLLPKLFGKCILLIAVFSAFQFLYYLSSGNESAYYSTIVFNIVTFMMTITVVEFYKDMTTELLNKDAFMEYVDNEIGNTSNKTVYLIKLKNFDYIKQNCHKDLIENMISQLAESIKEYAMISSTYYLEDGRFVIIVHKKDNFSEKEFIDKMDKRFSEPFDMNGARMHLNLFIAIINLESGKISRNNFFRYFSVCDEMKSRSDEHIEIIHGDSFGIDQLQRYHDVEEAIERALVEKEFRMFYQPIVDTATGKIVSAEALIRLNDRVLGFISPEEFIPISENSGRILAISEFVIDSIFKFVKTHDIQQYGLSFVEMNLSVMQCMDKNLVNKLTYYINKHNIDPRIINLEITETATNFDEKRLKEQLEEIKKLGFTFSLDDYGTGYSNLVRVLEYPVDIIKLDKSIIWSAFHENDNYVTLKNLIAMFHDVRRKIVAEGVESEEQKKELINLGCDYLQGYYYSKPVCEEEFLRLVEKHNNEVK